FVIGGDTVPPRTRARFGAVDPGPFPRGGVVYVSKGGARFAGGGPWTIREKHPPPSRGRPPLARAPPRGGAPPAGRAPPGPGEGGGSAVHRRDGRRRHSASGLPRAA